MVITTGDTTEVSGDRCVGGAGRGSGRGHPVVVDGLIRGRWASDFPWATLLINVSGSLLLGVLTGLVLFRGSPTDL
jgi:fluoride ion exporter CrcB/FEX